LHVPATGGHRGHRSTPTFGGSTGRPAVDPPTVRSRVTEAGTVGPVRTYRWTIVTAVIGVVLLVLVLVALFI